MLRNTFFISFFILFSSFSHTGKNNADAIKGTWMSMEGNLKVEVYKKGNEYFSKVIWFDDTDDLSNPMATRMDTKNPDKTLRNRKIIGTEVMHGLVYNADDDEWQDGIIYDCSSGKEWNAKAWINSEGVLKVRGYWHLSIFGQNINFKKS